MADYRGTSAYDLSLFEPQVVAPRKSSAQRSSAAPAKKPEPSRAPSRTPVKTPEKSPSTIKKAAAVADNFQTEYARNAKTTAISPSFKKAAVFLAVCFMLVLGLLSMRAQSDKLSSQIYSVQKQIDIADGERVRLNAELSAKMSSEKFENYAEKVLGMVKAESYQITYIDLSDGDEIVVSGDKTVNSEDSFSAKVKELFAYIF